MAATTYLDFDLLIEGAEAGYRARVLNSPAGQATAKFSPPFSELELENFLLRVGRTRRGVRRLESPEMEAARAFGGRLFEAVIADEVRDRLRSSLNEANRRGMGLRIRLRLADVPELADLPWEYFYDPTLDRFLVLSVETPLVRYLDLPQLIRPLAVEPPLRVMVMISSPSDHPPLNVDQEWAKLKAALSDLEQRELVTLERLERATLAALQRRLRRGEYHIFHFIGHGGFDERAQDGVLIMEDEQGRGRSVSGRYLGTLLHDHRPLRLAVLNACEGARASRSDPFAGTAQSLVQQGIPAVIAMQFEITDQAAVTLAHEFYGALADGYPVDAALTEARKAVFARGNDVEWGTPVLYMRAPDGRLFDLAAPSRQQVEGERRAEEKAGQQAAELPLEWSPVADEQRRETTKTESEPLPKPAGARRHWRRVAIAFLGLVVLALIVGSVINNVLNGTVATPTPSLPTLAVVLSADLANCRETTNLANGLSRALADVNLGERVTIQRIDAPSAQVRAEAERLAALAAVWGECVEGTQTLAVTIAFTARSPYPVSLLQEPDEVTLHADSTEVETFAQASVLYAVGQYTAAHRTLRPLANTYANDPSERERPHFDWLWGNILLRLEDWQEALTAYTRALEGLTEDSPIRDDLWASRGLTSLFMAQADNDFLLCRTQGREDLQRALDITPGRADLHVLLGTILLQCSWGDPDIEEDAWQQAEQALKLDPDFAPAHALRSLIGAENRAIPEIGDPLKVQKHACRALELDPTLPGPHRTLGVIYARYGLTDRAREEFEVYTQSATLEWQRRDASKLRRDLWAWPNKEEMPAPIGLGQCSD